MNRNGVCGATYNGVWVVGSIVSVAWLGQARNP